MIFNDYYILPTTYFFEEPHTKTQRFIRHKKYASHKDAKNTKYHKEENTIYCYKVDKGTKKQPNVVILSGSANWRRSRLPTVAQQSEGREKSIQGTEKRSTISCQLFDVNIY